MTAQERYNAWLTIRLVASHILRLWWFGDQHLFPHNIKSIQILFHCNSVYVHQITVNFCTCHKICTWFAKFCSSRCCRLWIRIKQNFWVKIVMERSIWMLADLLNIPPFAGTSARSASIRLVLGSVCWQIAVMYGLDITDIPSDYPTLVTYFHEILKVIDSGIWSTGMVLYYQVKKNFLCTGEMDLNYLLALMLFNILDWKKIHFRDRSPVSI